MLGKLGVNKKKISVVIYLLFYCQSSIVDVKKTEKNIIFSIEKKDVLLEDDDGCDFG